MEIVTIKWWTIELVQTKLTLRPVVIKKPTEFNENNQI